MEEKEAVVTLEKTEEQPAPQAAAVAPPPAPAPGADTGRIEALLRRLEEQSSLQTKLAKKRLFWGRLSCACLGVMAAAVVLTAGTLTPRVEVTLSQANQALGDINILAQQLEMADIPAILDNLDQTLTESRASLAEASEAVQAVSSIDFASLNTAILDLKRLLENPLGSLFGR